VSDFGELLRGYRLGCRDPQSGRTLSQDRLGELLGDALGDRGYSGTSIGNWETGKYKINADDRRVLVGLLQVLHQCGGLPTPAEAHALLTAGNYRLLDDAEYQRVFAGPPAAPAPGEGQGGQQPAPAHSLAELFFRPSAALRERLQKAADGPPPAWPRKLAALLAWGIEHVTPVRVARLLGLAWVCLLAWSTVSASLSWPFTDSEQARVAMVVYLGGALATPLFVGLLTPTRSNGFWQQQNLTSGRVLRLYTYQGAFVGFQVGYMLVFGAALVGYYLGVGSVRWLAPFASMFIVGASYTAAHLVPFNLWRAYGRLHLRDGAIVFAFILFGPLWSFYFSNFYALLLTRPVGLLIWLVALTLLAVGMAWQISRSRIG
jgi:hypothetical protein